MTVVLVAPCASVSVMVLVSRRTVNSTANRCLHLTPSEFVVGARAGLSFKVNPVACCPFCEGTGHRLPS